MNNLFFLTLVFSGNINLLNILSQPEIVITYFCIKIALFRNCQFLSCLAYSGCTSYALGITYACQSQITQFNTLTALTISVDCNTYWGYLASSVNASGYTCYVRK